MAWRKAIAARLNRAELARLMRFGAMGLVNVLVNYAVFAALVLGGVHDALALLAGTMVSVAFSYAVGGRLVFGNRGLGRAPHFVASYALVYAVNALGLHVVVRGGTPPLIGQVILLLPVVALNYALLRLWVFAGDNAP